MERDDPGSNGSNPRADRPAISARSGSRRSSPPSSRRAQDALQGGLQAGGGRSVAVQSRADSGIRAIVRAVRGGSSLADRGVQRPPDSDGRFLPRLPHSFLLPNPLPPLPFHLALAPVFH